MVMLTLHPSVIFIIIIIKMDGVLLHSYADDTWFYTEIHIGQPNNLVSHFATSKHKSECPLS